MIKSINFFAVLLLFVGMTLVSCEQEEENVQTVENFVNGGMSHISDASGCGRGGCFEFIFPIELTMPGGKVIEIDSFKGMKIALKSWKESNPDAEGRPELVFPIDVINQSGDIITVNGKVEMKELLQSCPRKHRPRPGFINECFRVTFPVSLELPNGDVVEIASKTEMKIFLKGTRGRFNKENRPHFVFPITVKFSDGTEQEVASGVELKEIKENCE